MLAKFAKLIGIEPRLAEDALHSERAAKHTLSRRGFFGGAAAAMAGAAVFSIPSEVIAEPAELIMPKVDFQRFTHATFCYISIPRSYYRPDFQWIASGL